ncbi:tumor necrosis factor receptor superfamily member 10D [Callithrix jacchus]|uniref:tumor necrosis factor receptor superfamily member 10D n=1 Tax=Callithrix jacchus TaxID=9483 RepID=UPI0023DD3040|nr:tumor necrosis factor receptor superfamily member 10D [Callithrix jacchus]
MELRGQSFPAASTASAGRDPGPRTACGTRLWLRDPRTLQFIFVVAVLLPVQVNCPSPLQDQVPQLTVAPQQQRHSFKEEECPPGSHRSEYTGACVGCTEGVDYANVSNNLPACLPCTVCKSDEEELSPCTTTRDTECQCKPGTFRNDNSTEICRKCHTGCPRGMIKVRDCTYWSEIKCIDESAAEETVTTSPGTPASVSDIVQIVTGVIFFVAVVVFVYMILFWKKLISFPKLICSGGGGNPKCVHRGQAEAEGCQRRRLQVPVNDADPMEINTLLDALGTPEEGHMKETIQDQLVAPKSFSVKKVMQALLRPAC